MPLDPFAGAFADPFRLAGRDPFAQARQPALIQPLKPEEEESALGSLGNLALGGLGWVGRTLDKSLGGATIRSLLGGKGVGESLAHLVPFSDTMGLTNPDDVPSGSELLGHDPRDNSWESFLGGTAAELALDPSTYMGFFGGALNKLGKAATKAGVMPKGAVGRVAGVAGEDAARLAQHLAEQSHAADLARTGQAGPLRNVAAEAQRLLPEVTNKPLGGALAQVGIPFGPDIASIGGERTARALDAVGDYLKYSRVGRAVSPLFDPLVHLFGSSPTSEIGQREVRAQAEQFGRNTPKLMLEHFDLARPLEQAGLSSEAAELRRFAEGMYGPARPGQEQLMHLGGEIQRGGGDIMQQIKDLGLPIGEWDSKYGTGYAARHMTDDANRQATQNAISRAFGVVTGPNAIRRLQEFDVPGGAGMINQILADPLSRATKDMPKQQRMAAYDYVRKMLGYNDVEHSALEAQQAAHAAAQAAGAPVLPGQAVMDALNVAPPAAAQAAVRPANLDEFAAAVRDIFETAPATNTSPTQRGARFFDNKVFLSHVRDELKTRYPGMADADINAMLLQANRERKLTLSRADLVQAMHPEDVAASELAHQNATSHFVTAQPGWHTGGPRPPGAVPVPTPGAAPVPVPSPGNVPTSAGQVAALTERQLDDLGRFRDLEGKAKYLARFSGRLPEEFSAEGRQFFGNSALGDYTARRMAHERAVRGATAFYNMLGQSATAAQSEGARSVADVLREAKSFKGVFNEEGPTGKYKQIVDRLQAAGVLPQGQVSPKDLRNVYIPGEVAADALRYGQSFAMPENLKPILAAWDYMTNLTKGGQTVLWPAFHARNVMSGIWQNMIGGATYGRGDLLGPLVDAYRMRTGGAVDWAHTLPMFAGMNLSPEQATTRIRELAHAYGARVPAERTLQAELLGRLPQELGAGELGTMTRRAEKPMQQILGEGLGVLPDATSPVKADLSSLGRYDPRRLLPTNWGRGNFLDPENFAPVKAGREISSAGDDLNRSAGFLAYLRQGYDPETAAMRVKSLHFGGGVQYAPFEREVMRRLIPFYGWTRQNLPFQLEQLIQNPGGPTGWAARTSGKIRQQEGLIPDYVGEGVAVPIGERDPNGMQRYLSSLGLPFEDINRFISSGASPVRRTMQKVLGDLNPLLKGPLEHATNLQFYSGRAMDDLYSRTGNPIADQVIMNSPFSRVLSMGSTLFDPRKGPLAFGTNFTSPFRITDVDMNREAATQGRRILEEQLRSDPRIRQFENFYPDPRQVDGMDPQTIQLLRLYRTLIDRAKARNQTQPRQSL